MANFRLLTEEELDKVTGRGDFDVQSVAACLLNNGATQIPALKNLGTLLNNKDWSTIYDLITSPALINNPIIAGCMCDDGGK